jgi:hypothetical protein
MPDSIYKTICTVVWARAELDPEAADTHMVQTEGNSPVSAWSLLSDAHVDEAGIPHTSGLLAWVMTRSWNQADSLARGVTSKDSPIL